MSDLYDTRVVTWTEQQAALLRRLAAGERINDHADRENVTEENVRLDRNEIDAVEAWLFETLVDDLKVAGWPEARGVPERLGEACRFPARAQRQYCPSMRQTLDLAAIYGDSLKAPPDTLGGQPPGPLPPACPLPLEEIIAGV